MDLGGADRIQRIASVQPQERMQALSQADPLKLQGLEERCRRTEEIRTVAHRQVA